MTRDNPKLWHSKGLAYQGEAEYAEYKKKKVNEEEKKEMVEYAELNKKNESEIADLHKKAIDCYLEALKR